MIHNVVKLIEAFKKFEVKLDSLTSFNKSIIAARILIAFLVIPASEKLC